jgi:hypothetical protein
MLLSLHYNTVFSVRYQLAACIFMICDGAPLNTEYASPLLWTFKSHPHYTVFTHLHVLPSSGAHEKKTIIKLHLNCYIMEEERFILRIKFWKWLQRREIAHTSGIVAFKAKLVCSQESTEHASTGIMIMLGDCDIIVDLMLMNTTARSQKIMENIFHLLAEWRPLTGRS